MSKLGRSFLGLGLFFTFTFILEGTAHAARVTGQLMKITDGDTVLVKNPQGKWLKVRMTGLDTPELHFEGKDQNPWAQLATDYFHELVNAKPAVVDGGGRVTVPIEDVRTGKPIEVELELDGQDKYGRELGLVFYKGTNLNLKMTQDGWAHPYLYCTEGICNSDWFAHALVKEFVEACLDARKNHLGVFDRDQPITETAADFRRRVRGDKPYQYIGDYKTKKLYQPGDDAKVDPCLRIRFQKEQDAKNVGYRY